MVNQRRSDVVDLSPVIVRVWNRKFMALRKPVLKVFGQQAASPSRCNRLLTLSARHSNRLHVMNIKK